MSSLLALVARKPDYKTCSEVSPICPVEATTLGYYPNLGVNVFAAIIFGLCAIAALVFVVKRRTWGYSLVVAAGCVLECAGYVGRVIMHHNPWNSDGFKLQIVAIVLGPTLLCVGIYLTLKHVCLAFNPALSRIRPRFYPIIFVPADVSCLLVQAIGGGIAAAAGSNKPDLLQSGNRTIIAGICLQVVVLGCFGLISGEYLLRLRKWFRSGEVTEHATALWARREVRLFMYSILIAYILVLIRCIYRIAEMAGGWGNHIMQDQPSFVVLETFMVMIASACLTFVPPPLALFYPTADAATGPAGVEKVQVGGSNTDSAHELPETQAKV